MCQLKYLRDQRLQKPLHSQGANFKTLGVPFQQDGGGGSRHGLCWVARKESLVRGRLLQTHLGHPTHFICMFFPGG